MSDKVPHYKAICGELNALYERKDRETEPSNIVWFPYAQRKEQMLK